MTNLLSSHLEDCSTPQYFCFSIRCEVCGEYWYSSAIPLPKGEGTSPPGREKRSPRAVQSVSHLPAAGLRFLLSHL